MRKTVLVAAALLAASSVYAREPQKKKEPPKEPPAPVVEYENDDSHMSDALDEACIAVPAEQETYDSRDNVLIVKIADGGRAFVHFKSDCDSNTMIFADAIKSDDGSQCVKPGGGVVFTSGSGEAKTCAVARINRWADDVEISPEDNQ